MQRYDTLPPGQSHLPSNWADNDPEFPLDGEPGSARTGSTPGETVKSDTGNSNDSQNKDSEQLERNDQNSQQVKKSITNAEMKTLFKALDEKINHKIKDLMDKLNTSQEDIKQLQQKIDDLENKDLENKDKPIVTKNLTKQTYSQAAQPAITLDIDYDGVVPGGI